MLAGELGDVRERLSGSAGVDSHEMLLASVPVPVMRSFLSCDGSWTACASRMCVHVNTVRYRIGRIAALTGRDLSALPDRVDFFLALREE